MDSHEIETYRGFRIRMSLEETPTHLVCCVSFVPGARRRRGAAPPHFEESADKATVGALNFTMAMQSKARALIDDWLAHGNV